MPTLLEAALKKKAELEAAKARNTEEQDAKESMSAPGAPGPRIPVAPSPPVFPKQLQESEPGLVESPVKDGIGQDWLEAWDPGKGNPPTDASRTLYAIITGKTSRDGKMILAYLREHYNTPAALVRLREYDLKMAKWASRRSR